MAWPDKLIGQDGASFASKNVLLRHGAGRSAVATVADENALSLEFVDIGSVWVIEANGGGNGRGSVGIWSEPAATNVEIYIGGFNSGTTTRVGDNNGAGFVTDGDDINAFGAEEV